MTARRAIALLLLGLTFAGCGPKDPYANTDHRNERRHARQVTSATTPASGELPGHIPTRRSARPVVGASTPRAALARAAGFYGNWSSRTAPRRLSALAAMSIGQAHAKLVQLAAQAGSDPQDRGVRSRSQVISISVHGGGGLRRAEVVTRDSVAGPGLPQSPEIHVVLATVTRMRTGWAISRWGPQP